jgi:hypothetical protein
MVSNVAMRPIAPRELMAEALHFTGRTERTLLRWFREGCNLASRSDLVAWMQRTAQRGRGAAIRQIKSAGERNGDDDDPPPPVFTTAADTPGPDGAAGALQRLMVLQKIFYQRQLRALKGNRPDAVGFGLIDYRNICELPRRFEKEVELARRDLNQMMPRSMVMEAVESLVVFFCLDWRNWLSSSTSFTPTRRLN